MMTRQLSSEIMREAFHRGNQCIASRQKIWTVNRRYRIYRQRLANGSLLVRFIWESVSHCSLARENVIHMSNLAQRIMNQANSCRTDPIDTRPNVPKRDTTINLARTESLLFIVVNRFCKDWLQLSLPPPIRVPPEALVQIIAHITPTNSTSMGIPPATSQQCS